MRIGESAFSGCLALTNIILSGSQTTIAEGAFAECFSLTNCTVAIQNPAYSSVNGVVFNKNQATLIVYPAGLAGSYVIPGSVTSIDEGAFAYCTHLWNVSFPDGITNIGSEAFYNCSSLTNAPFPSNLINIGPTAFFHCAKLQGISIGDSVTNIGSFAFANFSSLTNLTFLGNAPGNPGADAFENINPAVEIYYQGGTTGWGTSYGGSFDAPVKVSAVILPTVMLGSAPLKISGGTAGIFTNEFGFIITGASNEVMVVQVSSDLLNWTPLKTNNLAGTPLIFSIPTGEITRIVSRV